MGMYFSSVSDSIPIEIQVKFESPHQSRIGLDLLPTSWLQGDGNKINVDTI